MQKKCTLLDMTYKLLCANIAFFRVPVNNFSVFFRCILAGFWLILVCFFPLLSASSPAFVNLSANTSHFFPHGSRLSILGHRRLIDQQGYAILRKASQHDNDQAYDHYQHKGADAAAKYLGRDFVDYIQSNYSKNINYDSCYNTRQKILITHCNVERN